MPLGGEGADGFTAGNVIYTDTPARVVVGGNGANSAYVMAGLGVPTTLCSAVGRDVLGDTLLGWLRARGVLLDGVARLGTHATSTSAILMTDAATQVVFYHPGATAATQLLAAGARQLVIKRGGDGASLRSADTTVDVPGFPVPAVVSVGAGDTFNVGFLYGAAQRWSPERALRFGNATAALMVTSERGILGAPTMDQVGAFLAEHG